MLRYQLVHCDVNYQLALLKNLADLHFGVESSCDFEGSGSRRDGGDKDAGVDSVFTASLDEGFKGLDADVEVTIKGNADCTESWDRIWVSCGGWFGEGFYHFWGGRGGGCEEGAAVGFC